MSSSGCAKVLWIIIFFVACLVFIIKLYWYSWTDDSLVSLDVEAWLEHNSFSKYKQLFKNKGESLFHKSNCSFIQLSSEGNTFGVGVHRSKWCSLK